MTTPKHCLTNVTAVVDRNKLKGQDETDRAKSLEPLAERWTAFGWSAREINGHDMGEICEALDWASDNGSAPCVIIAHTIKGKGVSFIEGQAGFHNAAITPPQYEQALDELTHTLQAAQEVA